MFIEHGVVGLEIAGWFANSSVPGSVLVLLLSSGLHVIRLG